MTNYTQLSRKPKQFHALTGYTLEEFHALLPAFVISFVGYVQAYTLEGKQRQKRRYVTYSTVVFWRFQVKCDTFGAILCTGVKVGCNFPL